MCRNGVGIRLCTPEPGWGWRPWRSIEVGGKLLGTALHPTPLFPRLLAVELMHCEVVYPSGAHPGTAKTSTCLLEQICSASELLRTLSTQRLFLSLSPGCLCRPTFCFPHSCAQPSGYLILLAFVGFGIGEETVTVNRRDSLQCF